MMLYIAHHLFLLVLATALFGRSSAFDTVFKADRTAAQREARTTWVAKVNQMWSYPTGFLYRVSDVYFPVRFRQLEGKCANYNYLTKSLTTIDDCRLAEDQWRWKMVTYNGNSCTALEVVKKDRTGTGDCLRNDGKAVVPCSKRGAGEPAFDCAINSHYLIFALTLMPLCEGLNTDWSDTKKETCVDIDECREKGATCPSNSDCVNTQGDYSCRCKDGYINKDTKAAGAVSKTGTCEKGLTFTSASDVTTAGFKMAVASGGPINGTMTLNLYQAANEVEGFEIAVPTFSNSPVLFTSTGVTKKPMLFDNLKPGTKYEVKLNDITSDQVTTKCHCEAVGGDETGKPTGLQATQDNGFVTFAFTDNSLCEEGYGFYRKDLANSEEAFAPDYYYTSKQTCNNRAQYSPGLQAADDLHRSKLTVGQTYTYGVRAIARQSWRQSTYAEVSHKVLWEASVDGRVTLKPAAGSLPVERVTVEYRLEDLDHKAVPVCDEQLARKSAGNDLGWCTVESTKSGRFAINLSSKDDSDGLLTVGANPNIQEFPLHMRFRKTTGAIHHGFLCNDLLCSAPPDTSVNIFTTDEHSEMEGVETVYLRHLEFDHPVHVIDDTSVPFRGKITIKGTEGPGAALLGCPIGGAKVCLVDHTSRNDKAEEQTCVETDGDGFYELPAVYGSKISPVVKYHGHEFEAVNANHVEKFKKGIIIDPDTTYEGYNLRDVTTALMTVEVAGGLCNRVLGTSKIKVELPGCDWGWGGQILEQDGFSQVYSVVAHTVKLSLTEITGPDKDGNTIDKTPVVEDVTLDLRDVEDDVQVGNETGRNNLQEVGASGSNETDEALQKDEDDENRVLRKKLARFQYDGTDVITVTMATINGTEETTAGCKPPKPNGVDTYSYHVLPTWKLFSLTAVFRQDFGYGIDSCDKYPEGTTISIQNYLGIAKTGDEEWFAKYNKPQYAKEIKALQACQPSCTKAIEGNTVDVLFITGQPNPFGGMTKSLFITKSDKIHRADVVVTGDYELPGGFSVALPTHKPLLVLRDPPGGGSYQYYQNVKSTIKVEMKDYQTFVGFDAGIKKNFGVTIDITGCAGLGAMVCFKTVENDVDTGIYLQGGADLLALMKDESTEAAFTTTWSYSTSTDRWAAGKQSDVFLVPNIDAMFRKIKEVIWEGAEIVDRAGDVPKCARMEEKIKFELKSKENKPAIGFLSRDHIDNVEIPDLTVLRDKAQLDVETNCSAEFGCNSEKKCLDYMIADLDSGDTQSPCSKAITTREVMHNALTDWTSFLTTHDATTDQAANGKLDEFNPSTWFNRTDKGTFTALESLPSAHYSSLIPEMLAAKAVEIRNIDTGGGGDTSLQGINLIKFDGGGSEFKFEVMQSMMKEKTKKLGPPKDNSAGYTTVGGEASVSLKVGVVMDFEVEGNVHQHGEYHHTGTDQSQDETLIGFVLSDPDGGDVFGVEVFLDPNYGTFVFHTKNGRSLCPNEPGTVPRAKAALSLESSPKGVVLPDSKMLFQLKLRNEGISDAAFELYTNRASNRDLTVNLANGESLTSPQKYELIPAESVVDATVVVERGPVLYDGKSFDLLFRPFCDDPQTSTGESGGGIVALKIFNTVDAASPDNVAERIRFAEPCPKIEWAGNLASDGAFHISAASSSILKVVVHNPGFSEAKYKQSKDARLGQLTKAGLNYREVGTVGWFSALNDTQAIDFAAFDENSFGNIEVEWDISFLPDGQYEIEARTECSDLPGSAASVKTPIIQGIIDTTRPELFGLPRPATNEVLYPGQPLRFEFSEPLKCSKPHVFTVEVFVADLPYRKFDNAEIDNLLVVCEGRSISVNFDPAGVNFAELRGSKITARLSGVQDLNMNLVDPLKKILHQVTFATWKPDSTPVVFQAAVSGTEEEIAQEVARLAGVSLDRVQVTTLVEGRVQILITPQDNLGIKTWPISTPEASPLAAYHDLVEKKKTEPGSIVGTVEEPELLLDRSGSFGSDNEGESSGRRMLSNVGDESSWPESPDLSSRIEELHKKHEHLINRVSADRQLDETKRSLQSPELSSQIEQLMNQKHEQLMNQLMAQNQEMMAQKQETADIQAVLTRLSSQKQETIDMQSMQSMIAAFACTITMMFVGLLWILLKQNGAKKIVSQGVEKY